ncbi:FkbM family methyltransferase [Janibacter sp. UYMM211]|uniref:FkbM family methyltransferase n=1 Tax=Janibacter sp. UYMM211 TaxID=3156342 RepID=UPI0033911E66
MSEHALGRVDIKEGEAEVSLLGRPGEYIFEQVRSSTGFYEGDLLAALAGIALSRPGWIVDGGANIGNHTVYFATVFDAKVMAIEPDADNLDILRANVAQNALTDRVTIKDVALWDGEGPLTIDNPHPDNGGLTRVVDSGGREVVGTTLDNLCADLDVNLLKLDLEGAEVRALNGALDLLERSHPIICVEAHGPIASRDIHGVLAPLGYEVVLIGGRSDNLVLAHPDGPYAGDLHQLRRRLEVERDRRSERIAAGAAQRISKGLNRIEHRLAGDDASTDEAGAGGSVHLKAELAASREALAAALADAAATREVHEERTRGLDSHLEAGRRSVSELSTTLARVRLELDDQTNKARAASQATDDALHRLREAEAVSERLANELRQTTAEREELIVELAAARESASSLHRAQGDLRHDLDLMAMSYQLVSDRLESAVPGSWDHSVGVDTALALLSGDEPPTILNRAAPSSDVRPLLHRQVRKDHVRIGIATMPGREEGLAIVLQSLAPQADDIHVYLNEMDEVPRSLPAYDNVFFHTGPDHGDRGKFLFVDEYEGYYLTCDDDIAYPDFYVDHLIDGIERYDRKAVVGWHGSIFHDGFSDYYSAESRRVLAYYSTRGADTGVHLLGTGAAGFHTDTLRVTSEDFTIPNMADVWLALRAQKSRTPMVVLAHERGWADPIDRHAPSISNASIKKDGGKRLDVRETVTRTVADHKPWVIHEATETPLRSSLKVAIVGRTDVDRWRKGGILKSTHLMATALRRFGVTSHLADIETGDPFGLEDFVPDVVVIYAGDPDRPDYARAEAVAKHHMRLGRQVVINMSLQSVPERTESIVRSVQELDAECPGHAHLMVFTAAAKNMPGMEPIRHLVVEVPKTLAPVSPPYAEYSTTSGVFVGDIAKLADPALVGGSGREWVAAIRAALPGVPVYGVQQYKPRFTPDFELDEVWPFLKDNFSERLSTVRLMVAPTKYATYEMVPMEVAALGVPIVFREMPQSLSETLGLAGVEVDRPEQLNSVLPAMYRDPVLWRTFSRAGRTRAESQEVQLASGQIYLKLAGIVARSKESN